MAKSDDLLTHPTTSLCKCHTTEAMSHYYYTFVFKRKQCLFPETMSCEQSPFYWNYLVLNELLKEISDFSWISQKTTEFTWDEKSQILFQHLTFHDPISNGPVHT